MNQNTLVAAAAQHPPASNVRSKVGTGLTAVVVLFLAFDGVTKVIRLAPVMEACRQMGIGPTMAVGFGVLLLVCTAIHVVPRTAVLGAILLTGYLGGAAAAHVLQGGGVFPTAFAVGFGVLVWTGLALRDPRLVQWMLRRH